MFKAGIFQQLLLVIFQKKDVFGTVDMKVASDEMSHHLWSDIIEESREFILNKTEFIVYCLETDVKCISVMLTWSKR